MPTCQVCKKEFTIYPQDKDFYTRMGVPAPGFCFSCRLQQLMAYRNERILYPSKCELCGKVTLTSFPPTHLAKNYCNECWYGDKWDPFDYGRDYDFSRSFFEQFYELQQIVPPQVLTVFSSVNCDFTNCASWNKNCYLISGANYNEDLLYGNYVNYDKYSVDLSFTHKSELSYENIDCENNYHVRWATDSADCTDCAMIHDCRGCMECFCCTGLRQAKYHILNKQYSEEEYKKKMAEIDLGSYLTVQRYLIQWQKLKGDAIYKYYHGSKNESSTGDYFYYSKDCHYVFDATEIEGCAYVQWFHKSRNCYDIMAWGFGAENCYFGTEVGDRASFLKFTRSCKEGSHNLEYCHLCMGSRECFGCYGLQNSEYCIFNKKYPEKEYKELKEKIIEQMKKSGEYGQYFPVKYSPFSYNETIANDYFPLSKEEVLARGWRWQDKLPGVYDKGTKTAKDLPDNIKDIDEKIKKAVLVCET